MNYKLYLKDYYLVGGDYIQVTIPALTVNKTVEKQFETVATENEIVVSGMVGENIYEGIYTDLRGCTVSKLESGTLPSGISYLEKQPAFSGVAKAVADNQKVVINTTNEYGETEKTTYNFLIGSTSQIVVESKTIGAKDGDKIYSHQYVYESIRVAGATGGAVVQLTDDCGGKFKIDGANIRDDDSFHIYTEDTGKLDTGTYIVKYRVRDKINVFKMVYGTLTVIVSPSVLVKTNIINNAQSEPSLVFYNHDLESEIWSDSYVIDNNIIQYETYLPQGNYSVCYYSYGRYGLFDKYIAINSEKILNYIYNSKATIKLNILDSKGNIFKRKCYVELYKSEDFEKNAFPYSVHTAYPYYDLQLATLIDGKFADVLPGNYVIKVFDYNTDEEISEPISVNVGRSDVTADIKTIISNY